MAGYGLRAFLISQSLNQIEKAYGPNNSILDNCHVRVAFATNDERTAKRLSDAIGSTTEMRAMRNYAGHRLAPWLSHVMVSRQETARQLITPGEIMQLPADEQLILLSGFAPIKANKVRYFVDKNFTGRVTAPPTFPLNSDGGLSPDSPCIWGSRTRHVDDRLYTATDKEEQAKIAARLNETKDEGGKDQNPELVGPDGPEITKAVKDKPIDIEAADPVLASVKIGEFVRAPNPLQRAHGLSQTTDQDLGI